MNEDEKTKEIEKKETDIAVRVPIWEGKYVSLSIVADSKKGEERKMKLERRKREK